MSVLPTTTSTALVRAILDTLRAHSWPAPIATVGYRAPFDIDDLDEPSALVTPAIMLTITTRAPATEAMTLPGRRARRCDFELHGVLSIGTPDLQIELLELADAITALLEAPDPAGRPERGQRWGLGQAVDLPTDILDTDQSPYAASLNGFDGRVISWTQTVYLPEVA